jgi:hypothetical protein
MTDERFLWYPRGEHSFEILARDVLSLFLTGLFRRSFRSKVVP